MQIPDEAQLAKWLDEAEIKHYLCGECHGLHLSEIQSMTNVAECRLFLEPGGLLISTELEVRPSVVMHLSADVSALNINFPALKLFLDVVDEGGPQLVASDFFYLEAGITQEQFLVFLKSTLVATRELIQECTQLEYLGSLTERSAEQPLH